MSDRPLKLMLIDPDPIYRTGLRVVLEKFPSLQVVAEAEGRDTAWQIVSQLTNPNSLGVDLVIAELHIDRFESSQLSQLHLYRQLKTEYPNLPVLLLTCHPEPTQLEAAFAAGVEGYCLKGIAGAELVTIIQQVAAGRSHWVGEYSLGLKPHMGDKGDKEDKVDKVDKGEISKITSLSPPSPLSPMSSPSPRSPFARLQARLRSSGLWQIDSALTEVTARLQDPGLPLLDRAMLAGHRRELLASRWLVNQLLATHDSKAQGGLGRQGRQGELRGQGRLGGQGGQGRLGGQGGQGRLGGQGGQGRLGGQGGSSDEQLIITNYDSSRSGNMSNTLFTSLRANLQLSLENVTRVPLEIDILREGKKRELLNLILQKVEDILAELRFSQVQVNQLPEMYLVILRDLWQEATEDFFGKYSTIIVEGQSIGIVKTLLQDADVVKTAILAKIPLVVDLFSYLLFGTPILIDNTSYAASSLEASERAEVILQNLLIGLANGVVQPLLNRFGDVEVIKQNYYDKRLISTREIERFRNNLSWKYRVENYFNEPQRIFESRYELFVLVNRGIAKTSVYAPRNQELSQLSRIQFVVTLALEFRDAIAPRLQAVVAFLGSGVIYVLTQVIGRAIGLIGRGILQGLGGSLQEIKNKKF